MRVGAVGPWAPSHARRIGRLGDGSRSAVGRGNWRSTPFDWDLHARKCRTMSSRQAAKPRSHGWICAANFHMIDEALRSFDSNCKLNPPLRSREHLEACLEGLKDGTIDIISSGHRPRSLEKKMQELDAAPFGMVSLETTLASAITYLVRPQVLSWSSLIEKLSLNPAKLLGIAVAVCGCILRPMWSCLTPIPSGGSTRIVFYPRLEYSLSRTKSLWARHAHLGWRAPSLQSGVPRLI